MLEAVINISEGRRKKVLGDLSRACADSLLDVHTDPHHNRSVFTLAGPEVFKDAQALAQTAIGHLNIEEHEGVHPRIGVVDVVPFVPLEGSTLDDARAARNDFALWAGGLGIPTFLYGDERTLPDIRRGAFKSLVPHSGPSAPHPTAGAIAVGVREILIAYNLWLDTDLAGAKALASQLRGGSLRTLGLQVGERVQLSCNIIHPHALTPAEVFDMAQKNTLINGAELVGLIPRAVLDLVPETRWAQLDLSLDKTIEARLHDRDGLDRRSSS